MKTIYRDQKIHIEAKLEEIQKPVVSRDFSVIQTELLLVDSTTEIVLDKTIARFHCLDEARQFAKDVHSSMKYPPRVYIRDNYLFETVPLEDPYKQG